VYVFFSLVQVTKNAKNTSVRQVLWVRLYELNAANKECKEHVCPSGTVCPSYKLNAFNKKRKEHVCPSGTVGPSL